MKHIGEGKKRYISFKGNTIRYIKCNKGSQKVVELYLQTFQRWLLSNSNIYYN